MFVMHVVSITLSVFEDWIGALIDKSVPIHVTINCNTLVQKILVLGRLLNTLSRIRGTIVTSRQGEKKFNLLSGPVSAF
jgi:hypothetical protein